MAEQKKRRDLWKQAHQLDGFKVDIPGRSSTVLYPPLLELQKLVMYPTAIFVDGYKSKVKLPRIRGLAHSFNREYMTKIANHLLVKVNKSLHLQHEEVFMYLASFVNTLKWSPETEDFTSWKTVHVKKGDTFSITDIFDIEIREDELGLLTQEKLLDDADFHALTAAIMCPFRVGSIEKTSQKKAYLEDLKLRSKRVFEGITTHTLDQNLPDLMYEYAAHAISFRCVFQILSVFDCMAKKQPSVDRYDLKTLTVTSQYHAMTGLRILTDLSEITGLELDFRAIRPWIIISKHVALNIENMSANAEWMAEMGNLLIYSAAFLPEGYVSPYSIKHNKHLAAWAFTVGALLGDVTSRNRRIEAGINMTEIFTIALEFAVSIGTCGVNDLNQFMRRNEESAKKSLRRLQLGIVEVDTLNYLEVQIKIMEQHQPRRESVAQFIIEQAGIMRGHILAALDKKFSLIGSNGKYVCISTAAKRADFKDLVAEDELDKIFGKGIYNPQ